MTREFTITEAVRELHSRYGIEVNRKGVLRRCAGRKIACRQTPEGIYLIPEGELQALRETFPRKGS